MYRPQTAVATSSTCTSRAGRRGQHQEQLELSIARSDNAGSDLSSAGVGGRISFVGTTIRCALDAGLSQAAHSRGHRRRNDR